AHRSIERAEGTILGAEIRVIDVAVDLIGRDARVVFLAAHFIGRHSEREQIIRIEKIQRFLLRDAHCLNSFYSGSCERKNGVTLPYDAFPQHRTVNAEAVSVILRDQLSNFRRRFSGFWIQSDDSAAQIVLHQSECEFLPDAQACSHQFVFVKWFSVFPLNVKVRAKTRVLNRLSVFFAESLCCVQTEQRHWTAVLHGSLGKAQFKRSSETFLEKWSKA